MAGGSQVFDVFAIAPLKAALEALKAGRRDEAFAVLTQSTRALPSLGSSDFKKAQPAPQGAFFYWRALLAFSCEHYPQALADVELALKDAPQNAQVLALAAEIFKALGEVSAAIQAYEGALSLAPARLSWRYNLALCFEANAQWAQALASFEAVIATEPGHAAALNHLALLYKDLGDPIKAQALWTQALEHHPQDVAARLNRALMWLEAGQAAQAQAELERVLAAAPQQLQALIALGGLHAAAKAPERALEPLQQAYTLAPDEPLLLGQVMMTCLQLAIWDRFALDEARLHVALAQGKPACTPFSLLALVDEPQWHVQAAKAFFASHTPRIKLSLEDGVRPCASAKHALGKEPQAQATPKAPMRIKLGYFSSDFHEHATAYLIAELIQTHDRSQFEVFLFSYGKSTHDAMQARLKGAADHFFELATFSDRDIAKLAKSKGIDIAVDLKGYTYLSRPMLFAERIAPVQVSYLGYPGSLGTPCMDYVVGDYVVFAAKSEQAAYTEHWVRLPGSYQINDGCWQADAALAQAFEGERKKDARLAHGLNPQAFVYCCFNNTYKITPTVFEDWMQILQAVPGSQLWLLQDNDRAMGHIKRQAKAQGVDPGRLVFAPRLLRSAHLVRHGLADVFLDTFPYNAHTTASDALRCGLPLITRSGQSFASRVAASLLHALDMAFLVTQSRNDYVQAALRMGLDPEHAAKVREQLGKALTQSDVFSAQGVRPWLEAAFREMFERACRGEPASPIDLRRTPLQGDATSAQAYRVGRAT